MYKKISYSERLSIVYPTEVEKSEPIGYPRVVQKVVDGKIVNSVEFILDESKNDQPYTVDDFALENLLASGVDLKEQRFINMSLNTIDKFVNELDKLPKLNSKD